MCTRSCARVRVSRTLRPSAGQAQQWVSEWVQQQLPYYFIKIQEARCCKYRYKQSKNIYSKNGNDSTTKSRCRLKCNCTIHSHNQILIEQKNLLCGRNDVLFVVVIISQLLIHCRFSLGNKDSWIFAVDIIVPWNQSMGETEGYGEKDSE